MDRSTNGMIRPYKTELSILYMITDIVWIVGSLWLLYWLYDKPWQSEQVLLALIAVVLFLLFSELTQIYRSWRSEPLTNEFLRLLIIWSAVTGVLLMLGFFSNTSKGYSRLIVGTWFFIVPWILCSWRTATRVVLRSLRSQGYNSRKVAIVGAGESGVTVAQTIAQSPWMGLNFRGFFDDRKPQSGRLRWPGNIEGNFEKLVEMVNAQKIDVVYITLPINALHRIYPLLDKLADTTVSVYLVPEFLVANLLHGRWGNLGALPTVSIFETPFFGADGILKRSQDIVLGSIILLLIAIPMLLIVIGIKLTSPDPVLFKQKRFGLDGQEIMVWKFRTMHVSEEGDEVTQAIRNDPRVTRLGSFLRRTSLDELPQFINVLQGNMSIVGPRPHALLHNEQYRSLIKGYMLRHKVKPGITGWAQVNGWRGETDTLEKMEQRIKHDLWYIYNWSLWLDIKIIFLTLFGSFFGKNAY